ncbi:MAG: phosphoglycerate kinase [Candidatus Sungbacteria bacterium]|nr:phosphoglycerate kinase [Candidatus Sungbacteria bacterium]
MRIKTLSDVRISRGTRVLLRGDFDVAVRAGKIKDDFRLRAIIPTIEFIIGHGGCPRLMGHMGRPHGKKTAQASLKPVAEYISRALRRRVLFVGDPRIFDKNMDGRQEILFFENLRFFKGEEENSSLFARRLSRWGDLYIDDAFANAHRAHASVDKIARLLPSAAGLRFIEEVKALGRLLQGPRRPAVAVLGGAKLETKLPLIERFLKIGYEVLVGGALVNPALPFIINKRNLSPLRRIISSPRLHLPVDLRVARSVRSRTRISGIGAVRAGEINYDIGPETIQSFCASIRRAKTIVWNGPLGFAEYRKFAKGTVAIARAIAGSGTFSVMGGGDTIALLSQYGVLKGFSHISIGGGAMLEFLAGKKLPGVEVLRK